MDRKEYNAQKQREYRAKKSVHGDVHAVHAVKSQSVNKSIFEGKGHGVPVNGYVLVSGSDDSFVVTTEDWLQRLTLACAHGFKGWSCKECL